MEWVGGRGTSFAIPRDRGSSHDRLRQLQASFGDLIGYDRFVASTAPMFRHMQGPAHFVSRSRLAHEDNGVCVGKRVTALNRARDQGVQHHFVARVK